MSEENMDFLEVNEGDTVTGTVVKVEEKQVLVEFGYKTEGILPIRELSSLHVDQASDVVNEGDELTLLVKKVDDDEVVLSKRAIDAEQAWRELEATHDNNERFETTDKEVVKGGLVVDVGIRGFIPASLVETYFVDDFSDYVGRDLAVKVIDLDRDQNRVILSHRAVTEEEEAEKKAELLQSLEAGQVIKGKVERITSFGAFVDIGGVDGLVHISQLAHEHVEKVEDAVSEGDEIQVEVLSVDLDNERISLSRKNTLPGPWENIEEKVSSGDVVEGTVKRLVNFGAFVELFPGVEGLVHISQIANRHIGTPDEVLEEGETIKVKVLDVNERDERISLSIKELEEAGNTEQNYADYNMEDDQSTFHVGDIIGDQLDKFKK